MSADGLPPADVLELEAGPSAATCPAAALVAVQRECAYCGPRLALLFSRPVGRVCRRCEYRRQHGLLPRRPRGRPRRGK